MITLTSNSEAAIAKQEQVEMIYLLSLNFNGTIFRCAHRRIVVNDVLWAGIILNHGPLNTKQSTDSSSVSVMNFTLSDQIKYMFDRTNPELIRAWVYVHFPSEAGGTTLVMKGKVLSNFNWNEQSKEMSVEVESQVQSSEIGYSIKEGDFGSQNDVAIGQPFPIVFGTAAHVPAVYAQRKPHTRLLYPITFTPLGDLYTRDTFPSTVRFFNEAVGTIQKIHLKAGTIKSVVGGELVENKIYFESSDGFPQGTDITISIDNVHFKGKLQDNVFTVSENNVSRYPRIPLAPDPSGSFLSAKLNPPTWQQWAKVVDLTDHYVVIDQRGGLDGPDIRTKCIRQENEIATFKDYKYKKRTTPPVVLNERHPYGFNMAIIEARVLPITGLTGDLEQEIQRVKDKLEFMSFVDGDEEEDKYALLINLLEDLNKLRNAFWERPASSEAVLEDFDYPDYYVVNLVPAVSIKSVYGLRDGELTPIPSRYYQKRINIPMDGADRNVAAVTFPRPLASFHNQGWADNIYVTVESTLPSNVAYVIKTILEYTDLEIDSASFDEVAAKVAAYPTNFYIKEVKDALRLAKEIAWQARCALVVNGANVKIIYLSEEPTSEKTFNTNNIEYASLQLSNTRTEELVTRFVAKWRPNGYEERTHYLENNVNLYGVREQDFDFYIYNDLNLVKKSVQFWTIRLSNIWKEANFKAFHDAFHFEPYDCVSLQLSNAFYLQNSTAIKSIVSETGLDKDTQNITLWLPVLAGESTVFSHAWLSDDGDVAPPNSALKYQELDHSIIKVEESLSSYIEYLKNVQTALQLPATITETIDDQRVDVFFDGHGGKKFPVRVYSAIPGAQVGEVVGYNQEFHPSMSKTPKPLRAYVISVEGKVLLCRWCRLENNNVTLWGDSFPVLKPPGLWSDNNDDRIKFGDEGQVYTYTGPQTRNVFINGVFIETQKITPSYLNPQIIEVQTNHNKVDDILIGWEDTNSTGRQWAKVIQ